MWTPENIPPNLSYEWCPLTAQEIADCLNDEENMQNGRKLVSSGEVWQWPEWKALADRLGIVERHMRSCSIALAVDEAVVVNVEYLGSKQSEMNGNCTYSTTFPDGSRDTTTVGVR